jgi:hypothetical protein
MTHQLGPAALAFEIVEPGDAHFKITFLRLR